MYWPSSRSVITLSRSYLRHRSRATRYPIRRSHPQPNTRPDRCSERSTATHALLTPQAKYETAYLCFHQSVSLARTIAGDFEFVTFYSNPWMVPLYSRVPPMLRNDAVKAHEAGLTE